MSASLPGSTNPNARFSAKEIRAIRVAWRKGKITCRELAAKYGCNMKTIYRIVRGETYKTKGHCKVDNKARKTKKGERHPCHVLTEADVIEIRRCLSAGSRRREMAEKYGVTAHHIGAIQRGIFWKHLPIS